MFSFQISLLVVMFPSHISWVLTLKLTTKEFKPQACTHHVVIIVIIAMLTLCASIMSHVTLFFFYHTSMLNITKLFNITCTLVATSVILRGLECTYSLLTKLEGPSIAKLDFYFPRSGVWMIFEAPQSFMVTARGLCAKRP